MDINFKFAPQGRVAEAINQNEVWIDVGNRFEDGALDHHRLSQEDAKKYPCAATMIANNQDLVLNNIDRNSNQVTIVGHNFPDTDCIISAYITKALAQNGRVPEKCNMLVDYAEKSDTGRMKVSPKNLESLYAIINALSNTIEVPQGTPREEFLSTKSRMMMEKGLEVVDYCMTRAKGLGLETLEEPKIFQDVSCPFKDELDFLKKDYARYEEFISIQGNCEKTVMGLPTNADSKVFKDVQGLRVNKVPKDVAMFPNWARNDGFGYTSIPVYEGKPLGEGVKSNRVIISVDPEVGVNLGDLGQEMEKQEVERELHLPKEFQRTGEPRFNEPWCTNSDPWYDGRGHGKTIIDGPMRGSVRTIGEINKTAERYFTQQKEIAKGNENKEQR